MSKSRYIVGVIATMSDGAAIAAHDWLFVALWCILATWGLWPTAGELRKQTGVRHYDIPPAVAHEALQRAEGEYHHARVVGAAPSNGGARSRQDAP